MGRLAVGVLHIENFIAKHWSPNLFCGWRAYTVSTGRGKLQWTNPQENCLAKDHHIPSLLSLRGRPHMLKTDSRQTSVGPVHTNLLFYSFLRIRNVTQWTAQWDTMFTWNYFACNIGLIRLRVGTTNQSGWHKEWQPDCYSLCHTNRWMVAFLVEKKTGLGAQLAHQTHALHPFRLW